MCKSSISFVTRVYKCQGVVTILIVQAQGTGSCASEQIIHAFIFKGRSANHDNLTNSLS